MTWQDRGRAAWHRFRALPVLWQIAAAVVLVLAALWLYGALDGVVSDARDWWTDRELHELQQENQELQRERDALQQQIAVERGRRVEIERELQAKQAEIDALAEQGRQQDEQIITTRKQYRDARGGRRRADDGRWPDADLRDLYPADPQR